MVCSCCVIFWRILKTENFENILKNDQCVFDFLHNQGNRDMYITIFLAYSRHILSGPTANSTPYNAADSFTLDTQQLTIQNHILSSLQKRNDYYSTFNDSRITDTDMYLFIILSTVIFLLLLIGNCQISMF